MIQGIIAAILSPFFFGMGNLYDKYVVEHKIKDARVYAIFVGVAIMTIYLITALFLDWSIITWSDVLFPALSGILSGFGTWIFYITVKKEDISNVIGILYVYPIITAILSFIFLSERISIIGYAGMIITIIGTVLLTTKIKHLRSKVIINILILALCSGIGGLLVKFGTNNAPPLNCLVINGIFVALMLVGGIFVKNIRENIPGEKGPLFIAFIGEVFYFLANGSMFIAMSFLPATIVASIAAVQPLIVVFFESILNRFAKISADLRLKEKLMSISLIVLGVILIYITEL